MAELRLKKTPNVKDLQNKTDYYDENIVKKAQQANQVNKWQGQTNNQQTSNSHQQSRSNLQQHRQIKSHHANVDNFMNYANVEETEELIKQQKEELDVLSTSLEAIRSKTSSKQQSKQAKQHIQTILNNNTVNTNNTNNINNANANQQHPSQQQQTMGFHSGKTIHSTAATLQKGRQRMGQQQKQAGGHSQSINMQILKGNVSNLPNTINVMPLSASNWKQQQQLQQSQTQQQHQMLQQEQFQLYAQTTTHQQQAHQHNLNQNMQSASKNNLKENLSFETKNFDINRNTFHLQQSQQNQQRLKNMPLLLPTPNPAIVQKNSTIKRIDRTAGGAAGSFSTATSSIHHKPELSQLQQVADTAASSKQFSVPQYAQTTKNKQQRSNTFSINPSLLENMRHTSQHIVSLKHKAFVLPSSNLPIAIQEANNKIKLKSNTQMLYNIYSGINANTIHNVIPQQQHSQYLLPAQKELTPQKINSKNITQSHHHALNVQTHTQQQSLLKSMVKDKDHSQQIERENEQLKNLLQRTKQVLNAYHRMQCQWQEEKMAMQLQIRKLIEENANPQSNQVYHDDSDVVEEHI